MSAIPHIGKTVRQRLVVRKLQQVNVPNEHRPAPSLVAWAAILPYVGLMTFATWEFAVRVLPMIWRMS